MTGISILIPNNFIAERKYAISTLFNDILGVSFDSIEAYHMSDYTIILPGNKTIIIKDHFFSKFKDDSPSVYLSSTSIPFIINLIKNKFTFEKDIPVLFGNDELNIDENCIVCGIDVFASVFFMLTRWEEYVLPQKDLHFRFPAEASLAFKNNFLHRPVVNEYAEMIWAMIMELIPSLIIRKPSTFELVLTHDIDIIGSPVQLRRFLGDIKKGKIKTFLKRLLYLKNGHNPNFIFDEFMDISDKNNIKSRFYFMTGCNVRKDDEDYTDSIMLKEAIKKIKQRQHIIGLHPSYNSYNKTDMFCEERTRLIQLTNLEINEGRQHVLRFSLPETWQIWEDNGMLLDSTMGYSSQEGFRCGTANKYTLFNFLTRKVLNLKELPLIVMDATVHRNKKLSNAECYQIFIKYINICKKYKMPITLLFHNNMFDEMEWEDGKKLYYQLFDIEHN